MQTKVRPKHTEALLPTGIVQQTAFWSRVKARLGWTPSAWDLVPDEATDTPADMLVVRRHVGSGASVAYVPFGPEYLPREDERGSFLERIAESLRPPSPA